MKAPQPAITPAQVLAPSPAQSQAAVAEWVEGALASFFSYLAANQAAGEAKGVRPHPTLLDGVGYALANGGGKTPAKRIRPWFLLVASAGMGLPLQKFYHLAVAIEIIHGYSLVHDDLPAMDDDSLRRGKPTLHLAWRGGGGSEPRPTDLSGNLSGNLSGKDNEAFAILVGDVLQALAFEWLAVDDNVSAAEKNSFILALARAAGYGGMVSGQWRDIVGVDNVADSRLLKSQKTGALIELALTAPLLLLAASPDSLAAAGQEKMVAKIVAWRQLAGRVGLLYQAIDDMLDETATSGTMGKKTGKDRAAGKSTTIALGGMESARAEIDGWLAEVDDAIETLSVPTGSAGNFSIDPASIRLLRVWLGQMVEKLG